MGMIGLFIGAIVLGLGYNFFQVWLSESQSSTAASREDPVAFVA